MASAYWVWRPEGKANLEKTGERRMRAYVRRRVHDEGLAGALLRLKGERDGNQHRGDGGRDCLRRIVAQKRVSLLADGVAERGHGALRAGSRQTQYEEEERAYATAKVADQNIFSPEQQDTCRYRFRRVVAVFMSRRAEQGCQGSVKVPRHSHEGRRKRELR